MPLNGIGAKHLPACLIAAVVAASASAADWQEVQKIKLDLITLAAKHAMEQQKTTAAEPLAIPFPDELAPHGTMKILAHSPQALTVEVLAAPFDRKKAAETDFVRFTLPKPVDMRPVAPLAQARTLPVYSGLAFLVKAEPGTSPEVRLGCRLIGTNGKVADIQPYVPSLSPWGENPHEIYLDWSLIAYEKAQDAVDVLSSVEAIELTAGAQRRAPERGPSAAPQPAKYTISDLRVVDYLKGSYDPSRQGRRFDEKENKWLPSGPDLTLQHRVQEITGAVAMYGGAAGVQSAIDSLDHAARTQCWDGSFLDGRRGARTVASGEYTYGFTTYGMLCGYSHLEKVKCPALDERLAIGPATLTRREMYQRMFYREAMSRTAALPSQYRDDIIGGDTLMTGANRVLGYAISMRMVADILSDQAQKKEVLEKYRATMQQIADAQGKYSGGFAILGEGNIYSDRGIHYDAGYIRTHMDWLIVGAQRTGDPLLVEMLRRYQDVFAAVMDQQGTGLLELLSERTAGHGVATLILPDATAQVGLKHKLPIIAQWGYNVGMPVWKAWNEKSGNHWTFAGHARGYSLGSHIGRLVDDFVAEPEPKDLGYVFPRQWPIWSSQIFSKDGQLVRTSRVTINPDGTMTSDFKIEIGEYLKTVGVPVALKCAGGAVTATAVSLSGWPKLLAPGAAVEIAGAMQAKGKVGETLRCTLDKESKFVITGPEVTLPPDTGGAKAPFRAEFTLTPEKPGVQVELTVLREPVPYEMKMWQPPKPQRSNED